MPANDLIGFVADPNVSIQESKAFTGNIEPGRRRRFSEIIPDIDPRSQDRDSPPAHCAAQTRNAAWLQGRANQRGQCLMAARKGFFTDTTICMRLQSM